jgi:ectoine hydroxylase-related dioxygenase (phytanoyl-CoA dioxygenase family)
VAMLVPLARAPRGAARSRALGHARSSAPKVTVQLVDGRYFASGQGTVGHSGHLSADLLRNQHDLPKAKSGMTPTQKYLFDLNGYIVLKNVFSEEEVAAANAAVDSHMETLHERSGKLRTSGLYGRQSEALAGDGKTGRMDMGGMLGWAKPHCEPFRQVLCHTGLIPVMNELLGVGYRLDHSPLMIAQEKGAEGHTLHGGAVTESGEPAWPLAYTFLHGQMRNQLLTVCMQLQDAAEGDGGFCVVPGSHKSNFPVPPLLADLADHDLAEHVKQPALMKGDCLIFTEAVLHGTLPWTASHQRRTIIYRFAPPGSAYGRGYHPSWPASALDGMTDAQRAVMESPFHPRMNRTTVGPDGEACAARPREAWKVEFDEKVFGAKYF